MRAAHETLKVCVSELTDLETDLSFAINGKWCRLLANIADETSLPKTKKRLSATRDDIREEKKAKHMDEYNVIEYFASLGAARLLQND